jgi:hypothetical protein
MHEIEKELWANKINEYQLMAAEVVHHVNKNSYRTKTSDVALINYFISSYYDV